MARFCRYLALLALLLGRAAFAQEEPPPEEPAPAPEIPRDTGLRDLMSARAYAMGGAYRALGIGSEAVVGNPAAMSLYRRYQIELNGGWDVQTKFAFGNVTVLDSQTNVIAAGLSYHLASIGRGEARRIAHMNTVASSVPISDNIMIGASGKHLLMTGARESNAITMDAGIIVRLFQGFTVSLSGHNLIEIANPDVTRYYALALGYSMGGVLNVGADLRADFGIAPDLQMAFNGGAEYVIANALPVRLGYTQDQISGRRDLSGGVGFFIQNLGIDLAYRHELGGTYGKMLALTLRLQTGAQQ